jgi:hypothetical protein
LLILYQNRNLDGQILPVIPADGGSFTLEPIQARNDGEKNTVSPPTFRVFFSEPTNVAPNLGWQNVGKTEEEVGFQSEGFWGGSMQPISPHESWLTTPLYAFVTSGSKSDVRVRIKVFYGASSPAIANFTVTRKQAN